MYTEQPGWYHAEGDPLDTKRFWNGSEWGDGVIGGEMLSHVSQPDLWIVS